MQATFYSLSKRRNSTKMPASDVGAHAEVVLKGGCSVLEPSIELQGYPDPSGWNYMYLMDFGRYYYISWEYAFGIWTATGVVDVLASYKSNILATTAQVLFSSSDYNLDACDSRIASTAGYTRQVSTEPFVGLPAGAQVTPQGFFCLTTLASTSTWATGVANTWFLTYQQMQVFAREILEPDAWESLKQFFTNPMDGIIDCYYLPVNVAHYLDLTVDGPINVGDYTCPTATGKRAQATNLAVKSKHITIDIPWTYSDFRRLQPYSECSLFVPYCGSKTIDTSLISDVDAILIDYSVDPSNGAVQAIAYVKQEVLEEYSGNMKVSLPVAQTQSRVDSIVGAIGGGITAISGFASGNPALGATGVLSAISSVITPASQKVCGGMQGSVLGAILGNTTSLWQQFRLAVTSRDTTDTPDNMRSTVGNVCSKVRQLQGLTGYVQTAGAQVSAACTAEELSQINGMLDSGIYIE